MAPRAYRSAGLSRSLTLLWTFVLASAAILVVGGYGLSSLVTGSLREQALEDNARHLALYADSVLTPAFVRGKRLASTPRARRALRSSVRTRGDVTGITIWSRGGKLVTSTYRRRKAAVPGDEIRDVLRNGRPQATIDSIATKPGGSARTRRQIVAWSALRPRGGRPVGVVEMTVDPAKLDSSLARASRTAWLAVVAVFGALLLAILLLVRGASARLARQNDAFQDRSHELLESTRRLEESLLETVETLNAAVEARDPYTAGHSQRVRRVSLAIGRELGLSSKQLGALGTAALFHDVGKIGIPDSILTKAGPLTPSEAAIMREHVTRGAEIVAKVSSFKESVPAVRHHHERWDGLGYPDGLSGSEIPLEASIIGLADAWDAMTTDRPYAAALSLNDALLQVHTCREKQFNPVVVDAFADVAKRRPAEVLPPASPAATVAAS
jgi:putative nucleotidyltransferase with HDIG domain